MASSLPEIPEQLTTARLVLRIPRLTDAPSLVAAIRASLPELKPWMPWATDAYEDAETEKWIRRSLARHILKEGASYTMFDKASGEAVGGVGADAIDWKVRKTEIGYWLRTDRTGNGLMTEATQAVADALQAMGLRRLQIRCDERNTASAGVARRCSFEHEGTFRYDTIDTEGRPRSTMVFARVVEPPGLTDAAKPLQSP